MSPFPTRQLGGEPVSSIGFGTMGLSAFYGAVESDEDRFKVLDAAYAAGCTFWDTADVYDDSEVLLGKWFKRTGLRDKIFLASKFGFTGSGINGSAAYTRQAVESSLKKLGVDHIDLYYLHRPDTKTPIEITVGELAKFVKAGKIKHIGLSECSASTLQRACAVHSIAALQVEYSIFTLDIEDPKIGVLKAARELGVSIIAYSPLGRGLLTGQYKSPDDFEEDDFRKKVPRYSKENFPNILKIADGLKKIGEKHNASAGQVALAWLLAQGDDVIPIPGTKKIKYLEENLKAATIKLSKDEVQEVRKLAEGANANQGDRYPAGMTEQLFADTPPLNEV
ncbi:Aldo/keto reductase [Rickenella mellea]|uniref:Aldo/keto reductase n=1 Tax=Rickenella mellea TaxID=50990 RepID=A0A4Y7QA55_9AGAM|nr:Aldo/keto reductase [Rickenella mellea]